MRLVLDTNVLLAGIATHGLCEKLLAVCFEDHTVVISEYILAEVAEHYVDKFKASHDQAELAVQVFRTLCEVVDPLPLLPDACRDADDLPVLGTAVAGNVAMLVTGDRDLQELVRYQNIEIVSPRQCYERVVNSGS